MFRNIYNKLLHVYSYIHVENVYSQLLPSGPGDSPAGFCSSRERSKKLTRVPAGGAATPSFTPELHWRRGGRTGAAERGCTGCDRYSRWGTEICVEMFTDCRPCLVGYGHRELCWNVSRSTKVNTSFGRMPYGSLVYGLCPFPGSWKTVGDLCLGIRWVIMLPSGPGDSRAEFDSSRECSKKLTRVPAGGAATPSFTPELQQSSHEILH